jgi:polysaccharide biosynthesis transport protein
VVQNNLNTMDTEEAGYGKILAALYRRRWWFLSVGLGTVVMAAILSMVIKPTYESRMQLLVESNYQGRKTLTGQPASPEQQYTDSNLEVDYATQINLMRGPELLQKAITRLHSNYPSLTVEQLERTLTLAQVVEEKGNAKVSTKIFRLVYQDHDPIKTQRVLEALQKVYQDYNLEQQRLRLTRGLAFINAQLPEVRQQLANAESALEHFRAAHHIVDPEKQSELVAQALDKVREQQRTATVQYQEAQTRYLALQHQLSMSTHDALIASRLSQSPRFQAILNELQKTEMALIQQRLQLTDDNPTIQQLLEKRRQQLELLPQEIKRLTPQSKSAAVKANSESEALANLGQLSPTDISLANQLLESATNLTTIAAREQTLAKTEHQLRNELSQFPNLLAEYGRLQPSVKTHRQSFEQLLTAQQELSLEIARGGFGWQVVEAPQQGVHTAPSLGKNLLLGAVAGTLLGVAVAFLRDAIDDSVNTSDDLKKQLELPLLGMIPEMSKVDGKESRFFLPFVKAHSLEPATAQIIQAPAFRESMDLIYQTLQMLQAGNPLKSLVVTSALMGEGKSTLALGLAVSAARLHKRVLLIDSDLRAPTLHEQLNLPNKSGLINLLETPVRVSNPFKPLRVKGLAHIDVLTSGPIPADPAKSLSAEPLKPLIQHLEKAYDLVVIDAPPVLGIVDAILTGSCCSGVVLVNTSPNLIEKAQRGWRDC